MLIERPNVAVACSSAVHRSCPSCRSLLSSSLESQVVGTTVTEQATAIATPTQQRSSTRPRRVSNAGACPSLTPLNPLPAISSPLARVDDKESGRAPASPALDQPTTNGGSRRPSAVPAAAVETELVLAARARDRIRSRRTERAAQELPKT